MPNQSKNTNKITSKNIQLELYLSYVTSYRNFIRICYNIFGAGFPISLIVRANKAVKFLAS